MIPRAFVTECARYTAAFADADYGIIYTYRLMEDPQSDEVPES